MSDRSEQQAPKVLPLTKESGKSLTVNVSGDDVALIAWRRNGGALLPLALTAREAQALRGMLDAALEERSAGAVPVDEAALRAVTRRLLATSVEDMSPATLLWLRETRRTISDLLGLKGG